MRRAVLTLGGTVAGLAALMSFKTHAATSVAETTPPPAAPSSARTTPTPSGASPSKSAPSKSTAPKTATHKQPATRTVTGKVDNTLRGPMQVELTLDGQRITKVTVLQRTDDGAESNQIDAMAIPQLTSETLAAQSARIDAVSGASYTSAGYIQSLQSALDQAQA
jgi:uncharacterized protein with FMN-binding domain